MILFFSAFATSSLAAWLAIAVCTRHGILDVPNQRSSHLVATPRGGGAAIYVPVMLAVGGLLLGRTLDTGLGLALLIGAPIVVLVGLIDDLRGLPVALRLAAHLTAAGIAAHCILRPRLWAGAGYEWAGNALLIAAATLAIAWMLNIYNFMDGIDGLAGGQAALGSVAILMMGTSAAIRGAGSLGLVLLGASLGFLIWNRPRARVFMGDAGSGFLGFLFGCVAMAGMANDLRFAWYWLVILGVFIVDSSVTLAVRAARGEVIYRAHRQHAYQHLAQRLDSHGKVIIGAMLIGLLWLLPLATLILRTNGSGGWIAVVALAPLVAAAFQLGAGRAYRTAIAPIPAHDEKQNLPHYFDTAGQ